MKPAIPTHLGWTLVACLMPFLGLVGFLVYVHWQSTLLPTPSAPLLWALGAIGAAVPLIRVAIVTRAVVSRSWPLDLGLLLQIYGSVILIFSSLYALLQISGPTPSFAGMSTLWAHEPGTLGEHVGALAQVFGESAYLSVVTVTTVGFGDITPASGLARLLVSLQALIGVGFVALALGKYFAYCTHEPQSTNGGAET